jgi:hypothetical protein
VCGAAAILSLAACAREAWIGAEPASDTTTASRAGDRYELASFSIDQTERRWYRLTLQPCKEHRCPPTVRLVEGDLPLDSAHLDWPMVVEQPVRLTEGSIVGVGDPSAVEARLSVWVTGEEHTAVATAARTIHLEPGRRGLLVHQSAGFEHVERRHYLYAASDSRLARVWTGMEPPGPHWSTVDVADTNGDGREEILFWQFSEPWNGTPASWQLSVLAWDPARRNLEARSRPLPVFAGVLGSFATASQARAAFAEHAECLRGFLVLDRIQPDRTAITTLSTRRETVEAALRRAATCAPDLEGRVLEWLHTPVAG